MKMMENIEDKIVAVLHDVLEDTDATTKDLKRLGLPNELILDIVALTKLAEESRENYIARVKKRPRAKRVKNVDIEHNLSTDRIDNLDYHTGFRLINKYYKDKRNLNE